MGREEGQEWGERKGRNLKGIRNPGMELDFFRHEEVADSQEQPDASCNKQKVVYLSLPTGKQNSQKLQELPCDTHNIQT